MRPCHRTGNRTHTAADKRTREGIAARDGSHACARSGAEQAACQRPLAGAPAACREAKRAEENDGGGKSTAAHRDLKVGRFRSATPLVGA
jgi:hypothetical protein